MSLLGSKAWWMPRWLEPVLPQLHLEGSAAAAAAPAASPGSGAPSPAGSARRHQ
jgi:RND superfamily putative drug exporter